MNNSTLPAARMRRASVLAAAMAVIATLFSLGCKSAGPYPPDAMIPSRPVTLSPGDIVRLTFAGAPEWNQSQTIRADGKLSLQAGKAAGAYVDVRFDMDVLLAISAAPHPFAEKGIYAPKPVKLTAWRAGIAPADDYCRNFRAENRRAFVNNARYFAD